MNIIYLELKEITFSAQDHTVKDGKSRYLLVLYAPHPFFLSALKMNFLLSFPTHLGSGGTTPLLGRREAV